MITIFKFAKEVKAGCQVLGACENYSVNLFIPSQGFIAASTGVTPPAFIVVSGPDDFSMSKDYDSVETAMVDNHKITRQKALDCKYLESLGFDYQ